MIAAIYARKSTDQSGIADDQRSVARQVDHARSYAVAKGWTVDEAQVYVDDGISGAEFANRPGFLRLMNALQPQPAFQVLIMSEESRLGREAIETAYALKQLVTAGVRVFFYLEGRERTLDSPTDKIMLSLTAYADELERDRARQRTYDALLRKARAGHVTGGRCFGYENCRTAEGVRRLIAPDEAAVVRRIFELAASGYGFTSIAKTLNADRAPSPRPQQARPSGWAPSSVREVLHRLLYRGEAVWNQTRKRNAWGLKQPRRRPVGDWVRHPQPDLGIVSDELWQAAHAALARNREQYSRGVGGRPVGTGAKYLLTGVLRCGVCGAGMEARSRSSGSPDKRRPTRDVFYGCSAYHRRGSTVCTNRRTIAMAVADGAVLDAVSTTLLNPTVLEAAVQRLAGELAAGQPNDTSRLEHDLAALDAELERLTTAVAGGGEMSSLMSAIAEREGRRRAVSMELQAIRARPRWQVEREAIVDELRMRLSDWQDVLRKQREDANRLLRQVVAGRLTLTPEEQGYRFSGVGTVQPVVAGLVPHNLASPGDLSWNQIARFLEQMAQLREIAGSAA